MAGPDRQRGGLLGSQRAHQHGFLEATLGSTPEPVYLLALGGPAPADVTAWLRGPATSSMIVPSLAGSEDPATHTMTVPSLAEAFDAIVYVDTSTASRLLGH